MDKATLRKLAMTGIITASVMLYFTLLFAVHGVA